ncbi:MAG TPA: hypothetical protein VIC62_10210, partial [Nakamurella sp.]
MPGADWLATAVRLGAQVDQLAAIAAYARLRVDGAPADPAVGDVLSAITAEVVGPGSEDVDPAVAAQVIGLARTFLRQALELID